MNIPAWLYVIYSARNDLYYVGITTNLSYRIRQHNQGLSPYTRRKGPWNLVYSEEYPSKNLARAREKEIKHWKSRELLIERLKLNR